MDKVKFSRGLNRLGGGEDELYCSRVYRLSKIDPYGWKETKCCINLVFLILRGEKNHVENAARWEAIERRRNAKAKASAHQVTTSQTEEAEDGNETSTSAG